MPAAGDCFPPTYSGVLGQLAPVCGEGGEEAGERIGEAHWAAGGGSHRPPLGETWHPAPEGERCNLGQQGAQLPQC